jgi:hypothetical protein
MAESTALRLADALEAWTLGKPTHHREAAAELRRLHLNFEAAKEVGIAQEGELMRLEAVNQKLLEVLELVLPTLERLKLEYSDCAYGSNFVQNRADTSRRNYDVVRTAIAEAEVEKSRSR